MATILLIEDNDDIRENTAEILELANYKVFTAPNGKIGVQVALEQRPDLVICDITMPVLDGYGVLHLLHKNNSLQNMPFIFLTAKAERSDVRRGMELGADDYITKPFDATELLNAIESQLKKSARIKQETSTDINGLSTLMAAVSGKDILQELKEDRNINRYKKKQVVYSEGNHPSSLFYVLKGKVKTYRRNEDGKELITGLYTDGEFIGYLPLLEGGIYKDSAEAMDDTELAIIPREDFDELAGSNPTVMQKFIRILTKNIMEKEAQLLSIAYNSLRKKVADTLLTLWRKYNANDNPQFSLDVSRDNLAAVAGVAKESLIRTLGDFRDEQLIAIREGCIFITDRSKLERMMN
ncbi:cAMP-binding domain of CRP or a regulatory subunit of cAMP-dependent protein kinases [Chitinophaga costaii]|uniref:cAMP-binding domain of CRP or a regulatory subunit of cAMP-dependent protein kinases n=1 Tax=Chitinophaga costaii TaxID=1335309 RepID=A0A1C4FYX6_9BACT|nr:response regulator [Chitinophaga costaii]PUZ20929.1 transcriptional regulator [Chitinophaga costaii]SCC61074.1 cAMP-binding domain of CRP or a regulatory subunit of cAMP-dependent protein kinases [Chitinophaga costaii]